MPASHPSSRRGSALLIVLGLLSFLMISAVAFSISMRTEYKAAAAYRQSVATRELLISAFTDARATVDYALNRQLKKASPAFDRDDPSTRTVEALAPFKYDAEERYGRLIASYNPDATSDDSIAYLLDDAVMRHIPPYIASSVYRTLELQDPLYSGGADAHTVSGGNGYRIDWSASWKPVTALIPDDSDNQKDNTDYVNEAVIGRMAWAVLNLSDSLDINAVGSASAYRGIGLTGSEFAFGSAATGSTAVDASERYDLLPEEKTTDLPLELPLFASNADLSQYAAQVSSDMPLTLDNGDIYPYSWEDAVDQDGDGYYSPFSVYSFWPNAERKKEDGTRSSGTVSADGESDSRAIPCNELSESAVSQISSTTSSDIASLVNNRLGSTGDAGLNFARMLADYIDQDCVPNLYDPGATDPLYPNAQPTVERVPMVCEVAFDEDGWGSGGQIVKALEDAAKEAFDDKYPDGKRTDYTSIEEIPQNMGNQTLELEIKDVTQLIGLRAYFPGGAESTESFTVEPEGIVGIVAAGLVADSDEIEFDKEAVAEEATVGGTQLTVSGGMTSAFLGTGSPSIQLKGSGIKISMDGDQIPVAKVGEGSTEEPQQIRLNFLVDFLFRVAVKNGSDVVDLAPADQGMGALRDVTDYPDKVGKRFDRNEFSKLDSQFFRITRPLTVTFSLQWKIETKEGENGKIYTAKTEFKDKPAAESPIDAAFPFNKSIEISPASAGEISYLSASDVNGAWFTIDPRYNWLSPMLGVTGSSNAYGFGEFQPNFSSPHWLFCRGEGLTSSDAAPSRIQEDYAAKHADLVPFVWGLNVEEIRYGHNDSGQMLLPAEVGFLPVPFSSNDWTPYQREYQRNDINKYYDTIAKVSFFRTLPVVDLDDGAVDSAAYTRYSRLTSMFKSFAGDNFPEEHRGIVHAFAGQDDYYTCQRLRQFAMLGIPSSIAQAAKVTFDRLKAASDAKRVSPEMLTADLKDLEKLKDVQLTEPKYDTFIRDYLFYVPEGPRAGGDDTWATSQELYKGASASGAPYRARTADEIVLQQDGPDEGTFVEKLKAYNENTGSDKLGQNDMTTLLAVARECFGDRQQLFLYILRADSIAYNSSRDLSQHRTLATARAVALVWRDAYGELPDRVVYYQLLP